MSDAGYFEIREKKRGRPVLVTFFCPRVTPEGLRAPSLCAHRPIRAGTRIVFENHKYRLPKLAEGMNRPREGFFLPEVQ
ncbi:hypothetical protein SAMN00790413_03539 [Deinococcus hopiensis KR-140]|uniref:Uncharacterized protein n=1 Tax=Deinococcus hopiensis KR-140 TaxID=695939 RepID=A0A1W1UXR7_9DEIO|nr:hypothetical protein SAMN00790413_03539 [Deinococcus hopiensis KR-140]